MSVEGGSWKRPFGFSLIFHHREDDHDLYNHHHNNHSHQQQSSEDEDKYERSVGYDYDCPRVIFASPTPINKTTTHLLVYDSHCLFKNNLLSTTNNHSSSNNKLSHMHFLQSLYEVYNKSIAHRQPQQLNSNVRMHYEVDGLGSTSYCCSILNNNYVSHSLLLTDAPATTNNNNNNNNSTKEYIMTGGEDGFIKLFASVDRSKTILNTITHDSINNDSNSIESLVLVQEVFMPSNLPVKVIINTMSASTIKTNNNNTSPTTAQHIPNITNGIALAAGGRLNYSIWSYEINHNRNYHQSDPPQQLLHYSLSGSIFPQASQDHRIMCANVLPLESYMSIQEYNNTSVTINSDDNSNIGSTSVSLDANNNLGSIEYNIDTYLVIFGDTRGIVTFCQYEHYDKSPIVKTCRHHTAVITTQIDEDPTILITDLDNNNNKTNSSIKNKNKDKEVINKIKEEEWFSTSILYNSNMKILNTIETNKQYPIMSSAIMSIPLLTLSTTHTLNENSNNAHSNNELILGCFGDTSGIVHIYLILSPALSKRMSFHGHSSPSPLSSSSSSTISSETPVTDEREDSLSTSAVCICQYAAHSIGTNALSIQLLSSSVHENNQHQSNEMNSSISSHELVIISGGDDQSITICQVTLDLSIKNNININNSTNNIHNKNINPSTLISPHSHIDLEYTLVLNSLCRYEGTSGSAIKGLKTFLIDNNRLSHHSHSHINMLSTVYILSVGYDQRIYFYKVDLLKSARPNNNINNTNNNENPHLPPHPSIDISYQRFSNSLELSNNFLPVAVRPVCRPLWPSQSENNSENLGTRNPRNPRDTEQNNENISTTATDAADIQQKLSFITGCVTQVNNVADLDIYCYHYDRQHFQKDLISNNTQTTATSDTTNNDNLETKVTIVITGQGLELIKLSL